MTREQIASLYDCLDNGVAAEEVRVVVVVVVVYSVTLEHEEQKVSVWDNRTCMDQPAEQPSLREPRTHLHSCPALHRGGEDEEHTSGHLTSP